MFISEGPLYFTAVWRVLVPRGVSIIRLCEDRVAIACKAHKMGARHIACANVEEIPSDWLKNNGSEAFPFVC